MPQTPRLLRPVFVDFHCSLLSPTVRADFSENLGTAAVRRASSLPRCVARGEAGCPDSLFSTWPPPALSQGSVNPSINSSNPSWSRRVPGSVPLMNEAGPPRFPDPCGTQRPSPAWRKGSPGGWVAETPGPVRSGGGVRGVAATKL